MIEIFALPGLGEVAPGDDLPALLARALADNDLVATDGDILVVTSKIVSKAEGRFVRIADIMPSVEAVELADRTNKPPNLVELILRESSAVVRAVPNVLITRHRCGVVMANGGIDASNVGRGDGFVLLLPSDANASARLIREGLRKRGANCAVVVSDSCGRPWRQGVVNIAIGAAGMPALIDLRGELDRDGRALEVTQVGHADLVASAAGLMMGEAAESTPAALVRGCAAHEPECDAGALLRPLAQDLFT